MKLILLSPYPGGVMKRTLIPADLDAGSPRWGIAHYVGNDKIHIVATQLHSTKFSVAIFSTDSEDPADFGLEITRPAIVLSLDVLIPGGSAIKTKIARAALSYFPAGFAALSFPAGHSDLIRFELKEDALKPFISDHSEAMYLFTLMRNKSEALFSLASTAPDYREMAIVEGIKRTSDTGPRLLVELEFSIFKLLQLYFGKLRLHDSPQTNDADETFATRVRDHILISPNIREHTIQKLSRRFLVSATVLKQRFRKAIGVSIGTYVRQHALERAKLLILSTYMTIDEIADETGYEFVNNFNRAFKAEYGETPFSMLRRRQNNV